MTDSNAGPGAPRARPLRDAVRQARIEMAERAGVVVDLRDAELVRLEMLNEALDPVYAEIPAEVDLFDRGVTAGDQPRLWIDMIAHVAMGRDKRVYRFVQDTRHGRRVIAESAEVAEVADAVTRYIARRMVERERALAGDSEIAAPDVPDKAPRRSRAERQWGALILGLLIGMIAGAAGLLALAWFSMPN